MCIRDSMSFVLHFLSTALPSRILLARTLPSLIRPRCLLEFYSRAVFAYIFQRCLLRFYSRAFFADVQRRYCVGRSTARVGTDAARLGRHTERDGVRPARSPHGAVAARLGRRTARDGRRTARSPHGTGRSPHGSDAGRLGRRTARHGRRPDLPPATNTKQKPSPV